MTLEIMPLIFEYLGTFSVTEKHFIAMTSEIMPLLFQYLGTFSVTEKYFGTNFVSN